MTVFRKAGAPSFLSLFIVSLFGVVLLSAASGARADVVKFKVLVKVADFPIVDMDRDLEYYLRNPSKFKGQTKPSAPPAQLDEVLNRMVVETMIFEENKVVGNVVLSATESLALLKNIKSAFGSRWRELLVTFDQDENSIKERLQHRAVVDKVIQKKIEDVLKLPSVSKDRADKIAQKSVDDWLKQLRGRYRIQVFE